jgi:brefeldin A-inhibited guanine nucleotide-exchange protein
MEEDNKLQNDALPSPPVHADTSQDTIEVVSAAAVDDGVNQVDLPSTLPGTVPDPALPNDADHDASERGTELLPPEPDLDYSNTSDLPSVPPLPPKPQSDVEAPAASLTEPTRLSETGKAGPQDTRSNTPTSSGDGASGNTHKRSMTISKGHNVSVVLITSALETIASSKEARRSVQIRESTQRALELIRSNQGGDRPREIFEPLRLACETRNEKLMIASLDCMSKLISYSFFTEHEVQVSHSMVSPPPSPGPSRRDSATGSSHPSISLASLVVLVAHTVTSCHTESTPDTVCLQIVKALLSLVLSPTVLVHHSSLLKAVRTVYNIFLLSTDQVNQMVAQGGLTQMVHHVFTRCRRENSLKASTSTDFDVGPGAGSAPSPNPEYFALPEFEARSSLNGHTTGTHDTVSMESSSSKTNVSPMDKVTLSEMSTSSSDIQENLTSYAFFSRVKLLCLSSAVLKTDF